MSSNRAVGIDLGTSHCAIARLDPVGRSVMVRSPQGDMLIPSIVYFDDSEMLFGRAANQAAVSTPQRAAESVKRDFGQPAYSRAVGGELLPPELIEACLLRNLAADLPELLGAPPAVVLSVPASFDQAQRRAIIDAGRIAGLDLLGTINDPLAAALAFAEAQGYLAAGAEDKPGCRALVFDLGGGKLDVAIVEIKPGRVRTLAVRGQARLGGRDWDLRLADYVAAQFAKKFGDDPRFDMVSVRRLLSSAEEAKHTLTARQQSQVRVERMGNATDIVVPRHAFEEAAADLVQQARQVAEATIAQAGMAWRDVGHLLLVGGATRMPMIATMVESITGLKAATNMHADEGVARGALLYAEQLLAAREGRKSAVRVDFIDLTAHSLGVEWRESGNGRAENVVLIPRGTELPCATSSKMATQFDDQTSIDVQLVEGESRDADECSRIARITIAGLPGELPKNSPIEVLYQFTSEGRLQVKAQLPKTGQQLPIEVARDRGLSENEISDWRRLLDSGPGLKSIHALAARQAAVRAATAPRQAPIDSVAAQSPAMAQTAHDGFDLDVGPRTSAERSRKRSSAGRKIAIMLTGHVVFALLGLVIGYCILMYLGMLPSEWNVFRLRLPGVRLESPRGEFFPSTIPLAADARRPLAPRA